MRRLLLMRHGKPDYTLKKRTDEVPGPPLSSLGWEMVREAIPVLRERAPGIIYASPLARTLHSAQCLQRGLQLNLKLDNELREWHRTERLSDVGTRGARWLGQWLRSERDVDHCAIVVGHASPLLGIIRSALYVPHASWWHKSDPTRLVLNTVDRFELAMAGIIELRIDREFVEAEHIHDPSYRIVSHYRGRFFHRFPRPTGNGAGKTIRRPSFPPALGVRAQALPQR